MALSDEDIREILRIIDESELDELRVETAGFLLHVRKGSGSPPEPRSAGSECPTEPVSAPVAQHAEREAVAEPAPRREQRDGLHTINSPMLGTFYRAQAPGAQPFVEVGSRVEPDSTVCIIEVMKMMNSIPAGVSGTIVAVCPQNAELVEYGAPLFRVQPA
jgi:acetyl-CoA carboxylase biotin carboxyl carrier protein